MRSVKVTLFPPFGGAPREFQALPNKIHDVGGAVLVFETTSGARVTAGGVAFIIEDGDPAAKLASILDAKGARM